MKNMAWIIILVCFSTSWLPAEVLDERVEKALLVGKWQDVKDLLVEDSKNPSPVSHVVFGYACLSTGDYSQATKAFRKLETKDVAQLIEWANGLTRQYPENPIAHLFKADAFIRQGDYNEAIKDLDKAIEVSPEFVLAYHLRGITSAITGKRESALKDFDEAIHIQSEFADAYLCRGIVRLWQGDTEGALSDFNRVIELAPEFFQGYNGRGVVYALLGDYERALNEFNIAAKLCGGSVDIDDNIGWVKWQKQKKAMKDKVASANLQRCSGQIHMTYVFPESRPLSNSYKVAELAKEVVRSKTGMEPYVVEVNLGESIEYYNKGREVAKEAGGRPIVGILQSTGVYPIDKKVYTDRFLSFQRGLMSYANDNNLKIEEHALTYRDGFDTFFDITATANKHGLTRQLVKSVDIISPSQIPQNDLAFNPQRINTLKKYGYNPKDINVIVYRNVPFAFRNVENLISGAGKNYNLYIGQVEPVDYGIKANLGIGGKIELEKEKTKIGASMGLGAEVDLIKTIRSIEIAQHAPLYQKHTLQEFGVYTVGGGPQAKNTTLMDILTKKGVHSDIPNYWTEEGRPGALTESKILPSFVKDCNKVIVVGDKDSPYVKNMVSGLPPNVKVQIEPFSDIGTIKMKAEGLRSSPEEKIGIIGIKPLDKRRDYCLPIVDLGPKQSDRGGVFLGGDPEVLSAQDAGADFIFGIFGKGRSKLFVSDLRLQFLIFPQIDS